MEIKLQGVRVQTVTYKAGKDDDGDTIGLALVMSNPSSNDVRDLIDFARSGPCTWSVSAQKELRIGASTAAKVVDAAKKGIEALRPKEGSGVDSVTVSAGGKSVTLGKAKNPKDVKADASILENESAAETATRRQFECELCRARVLYDPARLNHVIDMVTGELKPCTARDAVEKRTETDKNVQANVAAVDKAVRGLADPAPVPAERKEIALRAGREAVQWIEGGSIHIAVENGGQDMLCGKRPPQTVPVEQINRKAKIVTCGRCIKLIEKAK